MKFTIFPLALFGLLVGIGRGGGIDIPVSGMVVDLDAKLGLTLEDGDRVARWRSQASTQDPADFIKRDQGRDQAGSGRPTLRKDIGALNGQPALVFYQQELVCLDGDRFDCLSTGNGNTWVAIVAPHPQRVGLKDVNSFFGNLRNGENYEGLWACFNDDNTVWWGVRNGVTFGRFDENNPKLGGPVFEAGVFRLVAGRMAAGAGTVALELFVDAASPFARTEIKVNPTANPSRLAVGQERDAIQHPGVESFDGEIARLLIWDRPLTDAELDLTLRRLRAIYFPNAAIHP